LKAKSDAAQCAEIDAALERLIGADGMGSLFKVLALTSPDSPQPAGL
jgi:NADH dehydrogenase [ubiquinone] 1 alpha subcomplex assembly factor 7